MLGQWCAELQLESPLSSALFPFFIIPWFILQSGIREFVVKYKAHIGPVIFPASVPEVSLLQAEGTILYIFQLSFSCLLMMSSMDAPVRGAAVTTGTLM